jgi:hypothetical protein
VRSNDQKEPTRKRKTERWAEEKKRSEEEKGVDSSQTGSPSPEKREKKKKRKRWMRSKRCGDEAGPNKHSR